MLGESLRLHRATGDLLGRVVLNDSTGNGVVAFSGGTGEFSHFHAVLLVRCPVLPNCTWDGPYWFGPHN